MAIVPPDAISGPITIVTPHGTVTSTASFEVLPPPLSITFTASAQIEISWPSTSPAFVLESSEDLSSLWSVVGEKPSRRDGTSSLSLSPHDGSRFYRLRKN